MDFGSFLLSVGTSFVMFVVLTLLFTWLSKKPANKFVYYPNRVMTGSDPFEPGSISPNPLSWIKEALSSTERDVVAAAGIDSAVYFVFLTTVLKILVLSGILLLPLLLPLVATESSVKSSTGNFNNLDRLSVAPIDQKSAKLWALVGATYWVSVVTYFFLWKAYKHVSYLRAAALNSPEFRARQFVVLVRDIPSPPKGQTRKELVDSHFRTLFPDAFYKSLVVTDNIKEVEKIYKELEGCKKKLAHSEAIYAESMRTGDPKEVRPRHKKVDLIEHYNKKINELISKLEAEQKVALPEKQQPSALVFFTSRVTAASVSQIVGTWTVTEAPEPCQIIWPNLSKTSHMRRKKKFVVYLIVALTIAFYMGVTLVFSAISVLGIGDGLIKNVVRAYLPQIVLFVIMGLLPKFLFFLSKVEGIPSRSHAEKATSGKYFLFSFLCVGIWFTVVGTFVQSLKSIENEDYDTYIEVLAEGVSTNAIFFMTFVALKLFVGYGLELSQIIAFVIFHTKRKYNCKTEAELQEAWALRDFGFESRVRSDMLILVIVFGYSVIAPIIIPFGALYFALGWLVLRNQVLKLYKCSNESYGRTWPRINSHIVAALFLSQIFMIAYLLMKLFYVGSLVLIPLPIMSLVFDYACRKNFYQFFHDTPIEAASIELNETPNFEILYRSYIPPSLITDKADEDCLSQV